MRKSGSSVASSALVAVAVAIGVASLGGSCGGGSDGSDGGAKDAAASDVSVAATCADVCKCLGTACPDYPFAPDCVTACQDPTNNPPWNLLCRANACSAAFTNHDANCPIAAGQTTCK